MANDNYLHLSETLDKVLDSSCAIIVCSLAPWSLEPKKYQYVNGEISADTSWVDLDLILKRVQTEAFNKSLQEAYAIIDSRALDFWKVGWRRFVLEDERYLFSGWILEEEEG